jgi:GNAT superfamily N-acetyltransferase
VSAALEVVKIRPAAEADLRFIFDSWIESYRRSKYTRDLAGIIYRNEHSPRIRSALSRCKVLVACDKSDENQIAGYVVFEPPILHYLYVKREMRRFGVGTLLAQQVLGHVSIHSHETTGSGVCRLRSMLKTQLNTYQFP